MKTISNLVCLALLFYLTSATTTGQVPNDQQLVQFCNAKTGGDCTEPVSIYQVCSATSIPGGYGYVRSVPIKQEPFFTLVKNEDGLAGACTNLLTGVSWEDIPEALQSENGAEYSLAPGKKKYLQGPNGLVKCSTYNI